MTDITERTTITAIIGARDSALDRIRTAATLLADVYAESRGALDAAKIAGFVDSALSGGYGTSNVAVLFDGGKFDADAKIEAFRRLLDAACWRRVLDIVGLKSIMDRTAIDELESQLQHDPPPFTLDNVEATVIARMGESDLIFKRGIARVFSDLDRRFKSHDGFKVGSRIIIDGVFNAWGSFDYGHRKAATLNDVERTFAVLDGKREVTSKVVEGLRGVNQGFGCTAGVFETDYFRVRHFKNGNVHLWMLRDDLVEKVNLLLADYYGDVLADAAPKKDDPSRLKTGRAVARKLQFYATPDDTADLVVRRMVDSIGEQSFKNARILEPSAGEGGLIRAMLRAGADGSNIDAIEFHPDRCRVLDMLANEGVAVMSANFLQVEPREMYDIIIMNPPFYGTHWIDHVMHAYKFLTPRGRMIAVLPATAENGESNRHKAFRKWAEARSGWRDLHFYDLPAESFSASGTNVNTVTLTLVK